MNSFIIPVLTLFATLFSSACAKLVFAHVVVGVAQDYTQADWESDMTLAKASGFDAFALDVGDDSTDPANLARAYAAAEAVGFKLFMSIDMNYFAFSGATSVIINNYITPFKGSSAQLYEGSGLFLSTFGGDVSGQYLEENSDINSAWTTLKNEAGVDIYFIPCWSSIDGSTAVSDHPVVDGIFQWQSWPIGDTSPSTSRDVAYQANALANGKTYMAPHSAWFFRHLNADSGDNFIYKSDDWLFAWRWMQLINMTTQPDFVEVQTWNDWGESHYLGPVDADWNPPCGAVCADEYSNSDFPHTPMLNLNLFFANWYKNGAVPAITTDQFYWWYRTSLTNAVASNDPIGPPLDYSWAEDNAYLVALVPQGSAAAKVQFTINNVVQGAQAIYPNTVNLVSVPLVAGPLSVSVLNSAGSSIYSETGPSITNSPTIYNFNYWSGSFGGSTTTTGSSGTVSVTFVETITTAYGQEVYLTGSLSQLSDWSTSTSEMVLMSAADYTSSDNIWTITLQLPANTAFEYKYVLLETDGVTEYWEADPNRSYTTPASGSVTVTDTWSQGVQVAGTK